MGYIEKLDLQTEKLGEVETLEKHTIINETISVNKYNGHTREFLAIDGDYNDGFTQLNKTVTLGVSCVVSKEVHNMKTYLDNIMIDIKKYGVKGNGLTDETELIQRVIDEQHSKGVIYFPKGVYLVKDLILPNDCIIKGTGRKTILKANEGAKAIFNIVDSVGHVNVSDLFLDGDNKGECGIYIKNSSFSHDTNHRIEKLYIQGFTNYGLLQEGENNRSCYYNSLDISNCKNGMRIEGTDNFINNCLLYWNKGNGLEIFNGANNKCNMTKCFGNSEIGLYLRASCTQINNLECQDNGFEGLKIHNCNSIMINNLLLSTNGLNDYNRPFIHVIGVYETIINGIMQNRNTPQALTNSSKFGMIFENSHYCDINLKTHFLANSIIPYKYANSCVSNKIVINNVDYSTKNTLLKLLGDPSEVYPQLSNYFDNQVTPVGSLISLSKENNTQYLIIGNNTENSPLIVQKTIDIEQGKYKFASLSWKGFLKNFDSNKCIVETNLMLKENANNITTKSSTDTHGTSLSSEIPSNCNKIVYNIFFRPKTNNVNLTLAINELLFGLI